MRRFHKAIGLRPNGYYQRLRVEKAHELLEGPTEQIGTIAQEVGYADPASFRKMFARITGCRRATITSASDARIPA